MLKNIFTWTLLLAAAGSAGAWAPPDTPTTIAVKKGAPVKAEAGAASAADVIMPPGDAEIFVDGALVFTHADRHYALKAIFSRATFDPGAGTYRPALRYQLSDFTDPYSISFWVPIDPAATPVADYRNTLDGTRFHIVSGERLVEITAVTNGKSKKYKFYVKALLDSWEEDAGNRAGRVNGYTFHFVPQLVWQPLDGTDFYSRSYVISGEKPLDDATGFPLDAIRTCTSEGSWDGCELGGFALSMASGLKVTSLDENSGGVTTIEEMDVELMKTLALEEMDGKCRHYNCDRPATDFDNW